MFSFSSDSASSIHLSGIVLLNFSKLSPNTIENAVPFAMPVAGSSQFVLFTWPLCASSPHRSPTLPKM